MIKAGGTPEALAKIAENMSMVVDPEARMRLSDEYLGLLNDYYTKRDLVNFPARAASLLKRVLGGRVRYKLLPSLGTISERFYKAYSDAGASLARLGKLRDRQPDLKIRKRWTEWLRAIGFRLEHLKNQAEVSSANAQLSQYDALANTALNLLAAQLMPAEVEWAKKLEGVTMRFQARGASAAVSMVAYPRSYNPGYAVPPATIHQQQYPYKFHDRLSRGGHFPGLSGFFDEFKQLVTGTWGAAKEGILADAKGINEQFKDSVIRAKRLEEIHLIQANEISQIRGEDPERGNALKENLAERDRQLKTVVALLNEIASEMKLWSYDTLDAPLQTVREMLGQALTTPETAPATALLFADRIREARARVVALEGEAKTAQGEIDALSAAEKGALAGGAGLALAAAGLGAYFLFGRKKR